MNLRVPNETQETPRIQLKAVREIVKARLKTNCLTLTLKDISFLPIFLNVFLNEWTGNHTCLVSDDMWIGEKTGQFAVWPARLEDRKYNVIGDDVLFSKNSPRNHAFSRELCFITTHILDIPVSAKLVKGQRKWGAASNQLHDNPFGRT